MPEELKPAYKQMQAAFTKKTQTIAEAKKEAEQYKADAEAYAKHKQYIPIIEEMLQKNQASAPNAELAALEQDLKTRGYSDEAIEMMKVGAGFVLNHFNQTQQLQSEQQKQQQEVARISSDLDKAVALDKRLTDQSLTYQMEDGSKATFGEIVEQLVAANPNWKSNPVEATKKAIRTVDALISNAKTMGKEELSNSARTKATKFPSSNSSPQSAVDDTQPLSIAEAFKQAQAEHGTK